MPGCLGAEIRTVYWTISIAESRAMSSERPNEATVFNAARQIQPAEERSAYIADTYGDDSAMRERVDKLRAAFTEESQFLEQPAQVETSPLRTGTVYIWFPDSMVAW